MTILAVVGCLLVPVDEADASVSVSDETSLREAVSQADTSTLTIQLDQDIVVSGGGIEVPSSKYVEIDLNSHNLTFNSGGFEVTGGRLTIADNSSSLSVDESGSVAYNGGKVATSVQTVSDSPAVHVSGSGYFTMSSGCIDWNGDVLVLDKSSRVAVNLNGGYMLAHGGSVVDFDAQTSTNALVISGSVLCSDTAVITNDNAGVSNITVNSGTFIGIGESAGEDPDMVSIRFPLDP